MAVNHRREHHWFGRGRTRALLSLGCVAMLGAVGTSAYWTDTATITGGTITAGTMDLQVAQTTTATQWGAQELGTGYADSSLAIPAITPSEAYAFPLAVHNVGNADFILTATVTQGSPPDWGFAAGDITVRLWAGSPVTTDTTYPIQQTCEGTALTADSVIVKNTKDSVTTENSQRVNHGDKLQLCALVGMPVGASNDDQGKTGQLQLDLTATQVTP